MQAKHSIRSPIIFRFKTIQALLCACMVSGCVQLGPDFKTPKEPWANAWTSPTVQAASERINKPGPEQWWLVFNDPVLNNLIKEADRNNSDVRIAGLKILQAKAQLGIAQGNLYPQTQQISADASYLDRNQSGGTNPSDQHSWQYGTGLTVGWELDFWGRFSRAVEASDASYFAAQANFQEIFVLLRAQIADTYFSLRTAEARLQIAKDNVARQERSLEITKRLFNSGNSSELDYQQAKSQYLGTLSSVPGFESQVVQLHNALAILVGKPPQEFPELAGSTGVIPSVNLAVLNDVPANLLLRRPDVRAAEWQVAAQSALVGVAETDLYPSLTLVGDIDWSTSTLSSTPKTLDLNAGPSFRWNVLNYGRLKNNVRVQDAQLQQLIESYRDLVRQAASEADNAAIGLTKSLEEEKILHQASNAATRSLELASAQYREGYANFQRVLDAQSSLSSQQDSYILSKNAAVSNLIALYKSLGGGWKTDQPLIDSTTKHQMMERTNWGNLLDEDRPTSESKASKYDN